MERDNEYLENKLYDIWEEHFADIPRKNLVLIRFGKNSKRALGSIRWANEGTKIKGILKKRKDEHKNQDDERISVIYITNYFKDERVPEFVVDATIAHELVHYCHGYHSPLPKIVNHPHRGRVVEKELKKRGLGSTYTRSTSWLKENWRFVVSKSQRMSFGF